MTLTADGAVFLPHARALMAAHDRALSSAQRPAPQQLSLGISDHAAGPEMVPRLERLHVMSSQLALSVTIGFSREYAGRRRCRNSTPRSCAEARSRRGGEKLTVDEFGWFATKRFMWNRGETLPLATLAPPCGVCAIAVGALDKPASAGARRLSAAASPRVVAAALAGLAVAPPAGGIAPAGLIDIGLCTARLAAWCLKVMLHSKVSDPTKLAALRTLAATFRSVVAAA